MISPTHLDPARAEHYRSTGLWRDECLDELLAARVAEAPEAMAVTDGDHVLTYAQLDAAVAGLAAWLQDQGVARGDVVSYMLPNWWEALVVQYATARIGAVVNPLHMVYRQAELRFVFEQCRPKVVVGPGRFRNTDYGQVLAEACASVEAPPRLLQVRADSDEFDRAVEQPAAVVVDQPVADDVLLLLYTSGTTSSPKGVLHTHNTLLRAGADLRDMFDLRREDILFMPSPVTHVAGLLYSAVVPVLVGCGIVFQDVWEPEQAMDLVLEHGCTFTGGATPFIKGLVQAARQRGLGPDDVPLRRGSCGGADVPAQVMIDAQEVLGASISRIYGLSEGITVTGSLSSDSLDKRGGTDGAPLPGFDVRIVDVMAEDVEPGTDGELLLRGPATCLGYLDASLNADAFDDASYFRSGDVVRADTDGYLSVTGRLKDIIIRGGENISAREVEDLLLQHPDVEDVAVVGLPDDVMGERACAFVVPRDGTSPDLASIVAFLRGKQIAPHKLPERIAVLGELPRTSSGKVQKFMLRRDVPTAAAKGA